MAEPELATAYQEIRAEVGRFLGYGRTPSAWTQTQDDDVAITLRTGLRSFYNCGFDWSFLKPVAVLPLGQGHSAVDLPDDYAAADGPVQLSVQGEGSIFIEMKLGPWQPIYDGSQRQPNQMGTPSCCSAEVLKGTTNQAGQRHRLHVFPGADRDYVVTLAYRLNADALSAALPYAYGGAQHSQTILQSCKAAAERDMDNEMGPAQQAYQSMLEQSQTLDRRSKPHSVGRMRDLSDIRRRGRNFYPRPLLPITVQGTIYD